MTNVDPTQLRRARPWYCWDVSEGEFYPTVAEAVQAAPANIVTRLLVQYRFIDDGSLAGRAKPVTT